MPAELKVDFNNAMIGIYKSAKDEVGYDARRFIQMVSELGGLETAKALVNSDTPSDGYTELWKLKRLDLTVEALVIQDKWQSLFEPEEIEKARNRLVEYGWAT